MEIPLFTSQWPSGLAFNHRLISLGSTPTSGNAEALPQYDLGCTGC